MLTNFVNHYKEKMFLGKSNNEKKSQSNNDSLNLEDLQENERDDITLDFE